MSGRIPVGLVLVGEQTISLSGTAATPPNSTIRASASYLRFSVETADVRVRWGASAPTLATGVLFTTSQGPYVLEGYDGTSLLRFCRQTGAPVVHLAGFKYLTEV